MKMFLISEYLDHLYRCFKIYRILTFERLEQKFILGVDPEIHRPTIRKDLSEYVNSLRDEFDYHEYFSKKRRYYPILFKRRLREDDRLSNWMNKIWLKEHLKELGVPALEKYYSSYDEPPSEELLGTFTQYVAKPAHLSEGDSVLVVSNRLDLKSGKQVDAALVSKRMEEAMSLRTLPADTWATRKSRPGILVEKMSSNRQGEYDTMPDEVKIYCVWGKVYFGVWRQGNRYQNGGFLYRDQFKNISSLDDIAWWRKMIKYAEIVADGSDLLRVDMFINGGQPVVNEVEIMPMTPVPQPLQTEMANLLNYGYSLHCQGKH
jgi:hypothetical protein